MSRLLLQIINGVVGIAAIGLGAVQLLFGADSPLYAEANLPQFPILDSNLRFFGGMGLGLGIVLLWLVPSIERQTVPFRIVWLCAFLGGVGRLISWSADGSPSELLIGFTALEVFGAPLLVYWQHRVAVAAAGAG